MTQRRFQQRHLNVAAAALLVIAGLLFVLTESVAPAVIGLILTVLASVLVFVGRRRRNDIG